MRIASLYSGGKDSTFSIYKLREMGHDVVCLLTIIPQSENSMLFHFPNITVTSYLAHALQIPCSQFESADPSLEMEKKGTQICFRLCHFELSYRGHSSRRNFECFPKKRV